VQNKVLLIEIFFGKTLEMTYQIGRPCERVSLSTSGLSVAEAGRGEAVDRHVDQPLDAWMRKSSVNLFLITFTT